MGQGNLERNERTRQAIVMALLELLEEKRFSEIGVTDIVARAGVARMSYYRNFDSKEQVIEAYIDSLLARALSENRDKDPSDILDAPSLRAGFARSLEIMRGEKRRVLALVRAGFASKLQNMMDGYVENRLGDMPAESIERFGLYFISGALLNVLIHWLEQGARESPDELAEYCARLLREGVAAPRP